MSHQRNSAAAAWSYCRRVLGSVSRTFAMTIPVLPDPLADTVCCAYLLCRIADTVEDEQALDPKTRERLYDLLERVVDEPDDEVALSQFVAAWPDENGDAYGRLMRGATEVLAAFRTLPEEQQAPVQRCAREMIAGMRVMTVRQQGDEVAYVSSSLQELERYCHYVAGTVGQMLTRLFDSHVGPNADFATEERIEQGRRFGVGLQLTNILKDVSEDRQSGISFVPAQWLRRRGRRTELDPKHKRSLVERTLSHLDIAHRYTLALPVQQEGIRLFCVWALWMAVTTLREICTSTEDSPKISRDEVAEIIAYSQKWVGDDAALDERYQQYRAQTARAAAGLTDPPPAG